MKNSRSSTKKLTITAILMAMTIVMCSFSIPVPGGHMYLNDIIIVTAAILLDPFYAFMAGGVGAFLGRCILLSCTDVCFSCYAWPSVDCHFSLFKKKESSLLYYWNCYRLDYHLHRLHSRASIYIWHSGICCPEASVSDYADICWFCSRPSALLENRYC
jgi:Predicted membrane protein